MSSSKIWLPTLASQSGRIFLDIGQIFFPVYAAFDLFFLSSRREGLPNSILEAMAMGLPVVTTDVAGAKELVSDGQTGYVLSQGDVDGLGRALITLSSDETLRQRMSQAGRRRVEREFSFATRLRRIEGLYEEILGVPPVAAIRNESVELIS